MMDLEGDPFYGFLTSAQTMWLRGHRTNGRIALFDASLLYDICSGMEHNGHDAWYPSAEQETVDTVDVHRHRLWRNT